MVRVDYAILPHNDGDYFRAARVMTPHMTSDDVMRGGAAAGQYLDSINQSDIGKLTADQWRTFLCIVVNEANRAAGERIVGAWMVPMGGEA